MINIIGEEEEHLQFDCLRVEASTVQGLRCKRRVVDSAGGRCKCGCISMAVDRKSRRRDGERKAKEWIRV